jgi:ammonia channel protein AmtB
VTVLSIVGTVGLLAMIPAFALIYPQPARTVGRRTILSSTIAVAAVSAAAWLMVFTVLLALSTGVRSSPLDAPVAALAAVSGFLATSVVRAAGVRTVRVILFAFVWTVLVFAPTSVVVFYPADVGLGLATLPTDLGGGLPIGVAAGSAALASLLVRRTTNETVATSRSAAQQISGALLLWLGAIAGFVALEGAWDATISTRILLCTLAAPPLAVVGWVIVERIQTRRNTLRGVPNGLTSGIVAIAAGAASFTPFWAGVIGLAAGMIASGFVGSRGRQTMPYGPAQEGRLLVGVHLIAGAVGLALVGLFSFGVGMIYVGQTTELQTQLAWALGVAAWSAIIALASIAAFILPKPTTHR